MNISRQTFHKTERLCSTKIIADLFENGNIFYSPHFKVVWSKSPVSLPFPAQVAFSISKKSFRLAVKRNLIKRRMREAYRRNKQELYDFLDSKDIRVVFIVIFRESNVPDYKALDKSVKEMITKFIDLLKAKREEMLKLF